MIFQQTDMFVAFQWMELDLGIICRLAIFGIGCGFTLKPGNFEFGAKPTLGHGH